MTQGFTPPTGPRMRVISDNDYAGDPDGLFQLAHLALSPSVELCGVIASHLAPGDPFDSSGSSAAHGVSEAHVVLDLAGVPGIPVVAGAETAISSTSPRGRSEPTAATRLIVEEALRSDTDLPLYLTFGGGMTELETAHRYEPAIADRLTAVWIGGPEHPGVGAGAPPGASPIEYNLNIDLLAAQLVFESDLELWQVPRNAYRQTLISMSELARRVGTQGLLGEHLYASLRRVHERAGGAGLQLGETYILGDNPLVLLTALMSSFEADPSSSHYVQMARPAIDGNGCYEQRPDTAPMRIYHQLDTRLMFEDFFAKLATLAESGHGSRSAADRSAN